MIQRKATRRTPARKASSGAGRRSAKPEAGGTRTSRRAARSKGGWGRRIVKWGLLTVLAGFLLLVGAFWYAYAHTTIPDPNQAFEAQTTLVYYKDGTHVLGKFATQNRTSVPLSQVPKSVQDAVIAAEDRTFYTNKGIDPKSILRAAFSNAQGNATQGASTITQQYVKVLYLTQQRTITRKIKEAFLSLKMQQTRSKNEILQGYLNTIYFGRGAYGIQAAANAYFNVNADQLSVAQGAVLASVLNSPSALDPAGGSRNRAALLVRYRYVLNGMVTMGNLSQADATRLGAHLPAFPRIPQSNVYAGQKGYMLEMVRKSLEAEGFSDAEIDGGGLRVTTTFTRGTMRAALHAVRTERPKGLKALHVAVASVDPQTGALRGFYAGQSYVKSNGGINWALAGGSPGSAFKPFALSAALKDGFSLQSRFDGNSPYTYADGHTVVNEGANGGNDYGAKITLLTGLEQSVNTAFADLTVAMKDGPQKILDTATAMGIPKTAPGLVANSGIALGSATISPIDMANAYGTIADGGLAKSWYDVQRVTDSDGKVRYQKKISTQQVISKKVAADVSYAMQQVVQHGTGTNALSLGRPAAGKTGTATNAAGDVSSSWFVGFTPQLSTAVMYVRGKGNEALNGYLPSYFGADFPTMTWTATMEAALAGLPVEQFPPPANLKATNLAQGTAPYTPPPPPKHTKSSAPPPSSSAPPPTSSAPPPPSSPVSPPSGPPTGSPLLPGQTGSPGG
ncbi:MAG: transglycosylase domain-containing protein [Nocardioidaceae bacterium]